MNENKAEVIFRNGPWHGRTAKVPHQYNRTRVTYTPRNVVATNNKGKQVGIYRWIPAKDPVTGRDVMTFLGNSTS